MFKFVKLKKNVDKIVDNNLCNKKSTIAITGKMSQKSLFVDKKGLKMGVIHIISTNCGYMDSNNVEMWITMGTPISREKKF